MSSDKIKADALKAEGNILFAKKEWALASAKYSQAIAADKSNAVLWCNRAACRLQLKQYMDALPDATKATKLDPQYSKAFARLASAHDALGQHASSIGIWQKALDTLPKQNLSPSEAAQKKQYETALAIAKTEDAKLKSSSFFDHAQSFRNMVKMPWDIANEMLPELRGQGTAGYASSAWVVAAAYSEFSSGVHVMKSLRMTETGQATVVTGMTNAITNITNGIMRDTRAFAVTDPEWVMKYNNYTRMEAARTRAWSGEGPELVIEQAQARLLDESWNTVRPAISITIRCWIMRGILEAEFQGRSDIAIEFLGNAAEVLKWGRTAWKTVPTEDRGVVFEDTFIRGVRGLYLDNLVRAHGADPGPNSKVPLEKILQEANEVIRDVDSSLSNYKPRPGPVDPGFLNSFFMYPKSGGLAAKGYYHAQMAHLHLKNPAKSSEYSKKAGDAYLDAAKCLPEDDERHPYFLNCAITNMWGCKIPLKETLGIMKQIQLTVPKAEKLWKNFPSFRSHANAFQITAKRETEIREKVRKGQYTLNQRLIPLYA